MMSPPIPLKSRQRGNRLALPLLFSLAAGFSLTACDPTALHTKTAPTAPEIEKMPEIQGVDHLGQNFSLEQALSKGPVVVIFYRGHW